MNDLDTVQRPLAANGVLSKHGIIVKGATEAIRAIGEMVASMPVGKAMVSIAAQGRAYGVRLFATPRFDADAFLHEMRRYDMTDMEVQAFVLNLVESP